MATVERQHVVDGAAEAKLPILGERAVLARRQIDHVDAPAILLHVVVSDALPIADPLLAGGAMGVLSVEAAGDHGLAASGPIEHDEVAMMSVGRRGDEIQHARAIGTLRVGKVIGVNRVARCRRGDRSDRDARAPRRERIGFAGGGERGCEGGATNREHGGGADENGVKFHGEGGAVGVGGG